MSGLLAESGAPVTFALLGFLAMGALTVVGSVRLAGLGDRLADRTGWGEALFGAVFFGLITSLSGIVMTASSAWEGHAELAYGNAVGGIAAQTVAIAVADAAYRRANLEHAAASTGNLLFGCLLIALLSTALLGSFAPEVTVLGLHPVSVLMVVMYAAALPLVRSSQEQPMWQPVETSETRVDEPEEEDDPASTAWLWSQFLVVAAVVAGGGWLIAELAGFLVEVGGFGSGFVGIVLMGLVNAVPETVAAVAAVRRGAMTLAIAAVLGGNCLDALNLVAGDVFYRTGSLYHEAASDQLFVTGATLLMTALLVAGLLVRQSRGWARIGFEGVGLVAVYAAVVVVQLV